MMVIVWRQIKSGGFPETEARGRALPEKIFECFFVTVISFVVVSI